MKNFYSILKRIITAPLTAAMCAMGDIDLAELSHAVDKRIARAESAVLRDYFSQHGLTEEEAETATESYREKRRVEAENSGSAALLRERAEKAEAAAKNAELSAELRVQMARMGVPESCAEDIALLTNAQLEKSEDKSSEAVKEVLGAVIARLPGLAERQLSSGSRGGFPRQEDGMAHYQYKLDKARAAGDNAAAVSIITAAANKGISLR